MPHVVTVLITHHDKILILKRSNKVKTYKGLWGGIAGYVEEHEQPYETALKEIQEEVGLSPGDVTLQQQGEPVKFTDLYNNEQFNWVVHPFIFTLKKTKTIQIDWEHTDYKWIHPSDIKHYKTVPKFKDVVQQLFS